MIQRDDAESVGLQELEHIGSLDVFHQGVILCVAGIGNNDVEVGDAVFLLELVDGGEGVFLDGGIVFDED